MTTQEQTTSNHNQKTILRKRLEGIESEIYISWLRDQDKVKELIELCGILEQIYNKSSIEEFFDNPSDFDYFCKKFSAQTIQNILKQHYVYGTNGDEIAMNVLFAYLRIFYKFMEKPQYQILWESVKEIFDYNSHYYKGIPVGANKVYNEKKLMSAEKYNDNLLSKKMENKMEIYPDLELDVLIENRRSSSFYSDKKIWVRGKVSRVEKEYFFVTVAEEYGQILIKNNSFEYAPKGSMTKDWEWRFSLQKYENIDCLDRGRWYPATISLRRVEEQNGMEKVDYRIAFRVYPHLLKNWEDYKKFWNNRQLNRDSLGDYYGDPENIDEWISATSKRIQKFNSHIHSTEGQDSFDSENYFIDNLVKFYDGNRKNYIIGRSHGFSYYYATALNYFCNMGGFEKMIYILTKNGDERPSAELISNIFSILYSSSSFFHKEFVIILGKNLHENIFSYINEMTQNELRNMKKETFDQIVKVLKFYLGLSIGIENRNEIIEKFSINFAIKMIKTTFLEKRITAVKTLVDVIKSCRNDLEKKFMILRLIEENKIFYEIYGPNSHIQLYNKSKDLLEIMLQEDKLSDGEMEMIWGATNKGDLEGKLTILKTLKEISHSMKPKHIKVLLENIYSNKSSDLLNDEIDLIYELSTHNSQSDENLEKCIKFFTSCLLESKNDEGERIEILINKIFEITKLNPSFKSSVIRMTLESLEKNENVNLALKILQKYLRDSDLSSDYDLNLLLVENDSLVNLFCNSFSKYLNMVREKSKNWIQDIDLLPLKDNFSHSQNIKSRLQFISTVLSLKLWKIKDDPIEFVFKNLIEQGLISMKDKREFFNWIKNYIDSSVDYSTEEKIFELFNGKICNDTKSCQNLSIEAFDTYLKIFLDINSQRGNLKYHKIPRENKYELDVYIEPEQLIGFQILWNIVFDSFSVDIMNKGIETLHTIFTNVQIKIEGIASTESKSTNISYSQLLLQKCIDLINKSISNPSLCVDEKKNKITKCLLVLKLTIEESEKRGTANIKSHAGILKKKTVNVKISSTVGNLDSRDFALKIYANTTIWELKQLISRRLQYSHDFLKIVIQKNEYELKSTDNGKSVMDFDLRNGDELKCFSNGMEKLIPQAEFMADGNPVSEILQIYNEWFTMFSSNEKMSKKDCSLFIRAVTGSREEIGTEDSRIQFLFSTYDRNKDELLEREEFLEFYTECCYKPDRRKVVWENLKTMGIRNDLKKMSEPYQFYVEDKTTLPRYQLAHNEEFFNTIFYLQDLNDEIAKEAFNFLCLICTNPSIYEQNLNLNENSNWNVLLDESNIYKLIYSLQIIESFIEDIEINDENVDYIDSQENDRKDIKFDWMKNFVEKGGYSHLIQILDRKLIENVGNLLNREAINNHLMNNICIEFLIKIVKIFYFSSLNKYETYKKTVNNLTKILSTLSLGDNMTTSIGPQASSSNLSTRKNSNVIKKSNSNSSNINALDNYFIETGLGDFILKSFDHQSLIPNLVQIISSLVTKSNRTKEESEIIETAFEFLSVIIPFSTDYETVEKSILTDKSFITISLYGLLNENNSVRVLFSNSLIKLCKLLESSNRFGMISYMFLGNFELIENISKDLERNSNELFEFFSYLLEMYLNEPNKFLFSNNTEINPKKFLHKLLDILESDILEEDENGVSLSDELFMGYLKIITKVAENNLEIKYEISNNYRLIEGVLTKILFKQNSNELNEKLSKLAFINPDKLNDHKSNRNFNQLIRNVCYEFILSMLKNSITNFEKFFSINVFESEENKKEEKNERSKYYICNSGKNEGHVGLRNLHFICYMNSMLQQFFMVPALRYNILHTDDKIHPDTDNPLKIDDNTLHQVQRMFSFLEMSERMDYNPVGFCYSFKDWEGNPTNVGIQQDAQEFLTRFLDIIENQLRNTDKKYILQSIFGGKTCSQFTCEQGCGTVSNRFEDFYTLSVEVNNMKTLYDSFEKLITPERIDEVNCETCKKKVTKTKRTLLGSLPNVLIVHLQRLSYNYEIDRNEKINSRLEFPRVLNLKEYCIEEVTRKAAAKKNKESEEDEKIDFETDDIYYKHPTYYEYHLVGVVIHSGSADSGHYYSYINTIRGGSENEAYFNHQDESHLNSWLEFNDSHISKFNVANLETESYGGNYETKDQWGTNRGERTRSAYMLVYERRIKSPIKIVVDPPEDSSNLVSLKEDEIPKMKKEYDLCRVYDTPEYNITKEKLNSYVFYDVSKNEYVSYIPYYNKERFIPKSYYLELSEDNSMFQKHQNISDERFVTFFENVIVLLDETMSEIKDIKLQSSGKISITFMNFIFNILTQKDKQQLLKTAKDKFLHILESQPVCLQPVWEYLISHKKQLFDLLLNDSETLSIEYCDMVYELILMTYKYSPQKFVSAFNNVFGDEDDMYVYIRKIVDGILFIFPRVPTRLISKTAPVIKLIRNISIMDKIILQYLSNNEIMFLLITFLLGRDSPYYEDTLIKKGDNWDYGRNNIAGIEPAVELICDVFLKSSANKLDDHKEKLTNITQRDLDCLKSPNFLKFIFKNCDKVFSSLLVNLNYEDIDFTIQSCVEMTKYIDDIYTYNSQEFVKLFDSIIPLLDIKDSYQRMRFEIILGIPQCIIDDTIGKNSMPLIGYHNLSDDKSKYFEYKGSINLRNTSSVLKKLFLLKSKENVAIQIYLSILEACTLNFELLKYIRRLKAEEPLFDDFIEWGVALINSLGKNESNIYYIKMKQYVSQINPILDKVMSDTNILPGFRGFMGKYLIKDLKREEITLIAHKDNVYLFELDYFGNFLTLDEQIDYSQSKSYVVGGSMNLLEEDDEKVAKEAQDKIIDESENLSEVAENEQLVSADLKLGMTEKEFFTKILANFTMYKKIIVENRYSVPEYRSLMKRYVIFNGN